MPSTTLTDQQVWELTWDGTTWSDWHPIGGTAYGPVTATSYDGSRIDVFTVGQDSSLQHCTKTASTWGAWADRGGPIFSPPSAVALGT